jgi:hypothetical protein
MFKGYVQYLQLVQEEDNWREDVSFDSHPQNAIYWENPDDADIKCQELNCGVRIPSSRGGDHLQTDFKVEQTRSGEYSICCEGPFILR